MKDNYYLDSHKLIWHLEEVHKIQQGKIIAPIYLEVSPVSYCNHHCNFCAKDFVQEPGHQLSIDSLNRFLTHAYTNGLKSVMFAGEGEPMLHKNFSAMINSIKNIGLDLSLTTNGSQGNLEKWKEILPQLEWIRFSINAGGPETYANVHRTSVNEFDKVKKSLESAIQIRDELNLNTTIGVQFVVVKENQHELSKAIELATSVGVDYLSFKPFSRSPQMLSDKEEVYTSELLEEIKKISELDKIGKTLINCRLKAFTSYAEKSMSFSKCHALSLWGYLLANGEFYTCPIHIGNSNFKAGNINQNSPDDILFGKNRSSSIHYGQNKLDTRKKCRVNCRMARINEFMEEIRTPPKHVNFI